MNSKKRSENIAAVMEQNNLPISWLYHPIFPSKWVRSSLYPLAQWTNGMAFRDFDFAPFGAPIIKIAEIKNGITSQTKFTTANYDECYRITDGDMLFSWSGQPETSIDVFWWRGQDGWLNQHIFKVNPDESRCLTGFFYQLLKYLKPNFIAIARNKQTTGLGHVTKADLERMEVALPQLGVQEEILAILSVLDDKIELNRKMNETLEAIARAIFKSWFIDFDPVRAKMEGRKPEGMDAETISHFPVEILSVDGFAVPKGWRLASLPEAIEVNPTRQLKKSISAPYLDMKNMPTVGHRALSWQNRGFGSGMKFMNGDTLVARITPCLENGKTAFVDFLEGDQIGWGSTEYIVLRSKSPLPTTFSYLLARYEEFRVFLIQNMTGTSGRQRVPAESLSQYKIIVPTPEVCSAFSRIVDPLFSKIKMLDEESRSLATIRNLLLPRLFTGQFETAEVPV